MRRIIVLLVSCMLGWLAITPVQAASGICFPQVPNCITGRFATFWQENGGLAVFGLPVSPASKQMVNNSSYLTQYFERARFELHPLNQKPYDVLLGRLGVDQLAANGRDWMTFPKADSSAQHYFSETGHTIAPQFWDFWSTHGLRFTGSNSVTLPESLSLFGLPISEAQMETSSDNKMYLTQWFERAKFEYHPENSPPYTVLLGLLGNTALQNQTATVSTPTSLPNVKEPTGVCATNAPPAVEGPQAWTTNPTPQAPRTANTLCMRLIINGAPVSDAQVKVVARYAGKHGKTDDKSYGPAVTDSDGMAKIDFNIGDAKRGFDVAIDVIFSATDGQRYETVTNFLPTYPFTTPTSDGSAGLPGIPAPKGNCIANAPPAQEGAQAWMTVPEPATRNQFDSICARLIVNGAVVKDAQVIASDKVFYENAHKGTSNHYGPVSTGEDGVAEIGFNIGSMRPNNTVIVDVSIKIPNGQTYITATYFRAVYK